MGKGKDYLEEEDTVLTMAWLEVSENALVGSEQKTDLFWTKIKDKFVEIRKYKEDSWNEGKKEFRFFTSWELLRDHPKWSFGTSPTTSSSSSSSTSSHKRKWRPYPGFQGEPGVKVAPPRIPGSSTSTSLQNCLVIAQSPPSKFVF